MKKLFSEKEIKKMDSIFSEKEKFFKNHPKKEKEYFNEKCFFNSLSLIDSKNFSELIKEIKSGNKNYKCKKLFTEKD